MSDGVMVVTSCTAQKVKAPAGRLLTAESLYTGQQHLRLLRGVRAYRQAGRPLGPLRLHVLSAYYGLIPAARRVATYDHTFSGVPRDVLRSRARRLSVPDRIRDLLRSRSTLTVMLLGDDYLDACALDDTVKLGGPTIAFCAPRVARRLPDLDGLRVVTLHNAEAQRFSCGLIALKGELAGRLLHTLGHEPQRLRELIDSRYDVLDELAVGRPTTDLPAAAA